MYIEAELKQVELKQAEMILQGEYKVTGKLVPQEEGFKLGDLTLPSIKPILSYDFSEVRRCGDWYDVNDIKVVWDDIDVTQTFLAFKPDCLTHE